MKIYLAARYSRREELCTYREELQVLGYEVNARWLDGAHQITDDGKPIGDAGEHLIEGDSGSGSDAAAALRQRFAEEDYRDVLNCDLLIAFTEPPRSPHSRGGRHIELGMAIGAGTAVAVVGYRENIFCWLPEVKFFLDFPALVGHLAAPSFHPTETIWTAEPRWQVKGAQ